MNKVISIAVLLTGFLSVKSFANNVTDDLNPGQTPQEGSILYYGTPSGNSEGTWALPSTIPGLSGAQGDQGIQGEQGIQGDQGVKGDKGDQGETGTIDQQTLDTINNNQSVETKSRIDADKLLQDNLNATNNRVDGLENEVHKLGETKAILGGTVRIMDSRKFEVHLFDNYDVKRGHNDSFGAVVGYKLGKSFEEKEIDELKSMLKMYRAKTDKVFKPETARTTLKDVK